MTGTRLTGDMCTQVACLGQLSADLLDGVQYALSLIRWSFGFMSLPEQRVNLLKDIDGTSVIQPIVCVRQF